MHKTAYLCVKKVELIVLIKSISFLRLLAQIFELLPTSQHSHKISLYISLKKGFSTSLS